MSREINSLGEELPDLERFLTIDTGDWSTFDEMFPQRGFPWQYRGVDPTSWVPQESGQQTTQNEEQQYYIKQHELLSASSAAPQWVDGKPWHVNDDDNLILRAIRTPEAYKNIAYVVLNGYEVVSSTNNEIRVKGQGYYDRASQAGRVGINKHERGLYTGEPLRVKVGNTVFDVANIIDEWGPNDPTQAELQAGTDPNDSTQWVTYHRIQVVGTISQQPSAGNYVNVLRPTEWLSGIFTSQFTFGQKYGRFSMRVKFPVGIGAFAAVWSWAMYLEWQSNQFRTGDKGPEVDFGECLGHAPDIWYHNAHQPDPYLGKMATRPDGSTYRTMKGYVQDKGLSPLHPTEPGWTGDQIQQHQVLIDPSSPDYINGATEFITIVWDNYVDNTAAWFVKGDNWQTPRMVSNMHMSPNTFNGILDERMWICNNAVKGSFNYEQERNDANYPRLNNTTPDIYDFEIDYLRCEQWTGRPAGGSGINDLLGKYPNGMGPVPGFNGATTGTTVKKSLELTFESRLVSKKVPRSEPMPTRTAGLSSPEKLPCGQRILQWFRSLLHKVTRR